MRIVRLSDLSEKERNEVFKQQEIRKKKKKEFQESDLKRANDLFNETIRKNQEEDNNKKNILDDIGYTAKSFGTGIVGGITGIAKSLTTETQNQIEKGIADKKNNRNLLDNMVGITRSLINPIGGTPDIALNSFKTGIETLTDKNSTSLQKIANYINNGVTNAVESIPGKGIFNESMKIAGRLNSNTNKFVKSIDDTISRPYNDLQKSLQEESQYYGTGAKIAGNVAGVVGNMVPSIAMTAITGNPNIGLATMGISAKGQSTQEALDKGADLNQAIKIGNTKGMLEIGTEMISGGVNIFGKGALDDIVEKGLLSKIENKVVNFLAKEGYDYLGEIGEEAISDVVGTLIDKGTVDPNATYSMSDFGDTAVTTILSTAVLKALGVPINKLNEIRNKNYRTENEQKVYNNEVNARSDEKVKKLTVERVYNKQIETQENLGNKMTEDQKAKLKKKVEKAYDNGRLEPAKLNNKDLSEIEKQVDNDMNEGNISWDRIVNTLGENQDISKDNLLKRSAYENEQRYNSYQVEKTNNEKVNILMQSAADAGMNNTSKTRKKVELIAKLTKDTGRQYKFVSPEQLKEMGYNEKANGLIDKSTREILINTHTNKGIQSIIGHETTHIFDGKNEKGEYSKEYQVLQDMAIEYAKKKGIYDSKIQSITEAYGDLLVEESQFKEELTADLIGDFLFNDEKFIESLAVNNRNIFQKIYDYIKHTYKMVTAKTEDAKALENLKYQFDKVYKTISENNNTDIKYSIAGKEGMNNAIKKDPDYLKLERAYNKAQQMQKIGMDNEGIRKNTGWFQDKNGDWKFEFSDKDMSIKENIKLEKNKTYKLGDILKHDTLFTAYPELANYNVSFIEMKQGGSYNRENNNIKINSDKINSNFAVESTLIHEIQHAIQSIEGFEGGKGSNFKLAYYKSLGEIEASDTKKRFVLEKQKRLDRSLVKPESSKSNPKHSNLNNYLKNRKFIDKIKDSVYNYLNSKSKEGGDSYESYQENMERNNQKDSGLVSERTDRDSGSDGTLGNRRNKNRENRKKDGEKISEINSKLQERSRKNAKAIYKNAEKDSSKVWNNGIDNNIEESGNNSGSFSLDKSAKRYEDLQEADTVKFNRKTEGTINIEILNNDELINQITVTSKDNASKQLGENIADYVYDNVTENSKTINLEQTKTQAVRDTSIKSYDNQGKSLSKEQEEYFKNSKSRDKEGNLKRLYHGTPYNFDIFNYSKLGENTSSLGAGFYFSDNKATGEEYARGNGNIKEVYVNITKPLSYGKTTMTKAEYKKLVEAVDKETNGSYLEDYGGINEALMEYEYGGDDIDLVNAIHNASGLTWKKTYEILRKETGFDGIISKQGFLNKGETIYVAFNSDQIKSVDNISPTSSPNINLSLTSDMGITGDDIAVRDMLKQEKSTIEDEVGRNRIEITDKNLLRQNQDNNDEIKNIDEKLNEKKDKITRKEVRQQLLQKMNLSESDISVGKDIKALNYQITDPVRVNEKVFGREIGNKINDVTINQTKHNTAEKIRWQNIEREEIRSLGIKARSKESAAVQKYAEKQFVDKNGKIHKYEDLELATEFKDKETQNKIKNAAKFIREKYDTYIEQMNNTLTALGYDAIPKRENYMRHFEELTDKFSQTGIPFNLNDMNAEDLPTDINRFNRV